MTDPTTDPTDETTGDATSDPAGPVVVDPATTSPRARGRGMARANRVAALVVLVALGAGAIADRADRPATEAPFSSGAFSAPEAPPADALGATWFCPFGISGPDRLGAGAVQIANAGDRAVEATVIVIPPKGKSARRTITVPAFGVTAVSVHDLAESDRAAVRVDVGPGPVVVEHVVSGRAGRSVAPCASGASSEWHLASGTTARDAREVVALFNPFPDDAIVDFRFATNEGHFEAQDLTGFVIPARAVRFVALHDQVRRRDHVAATITARTGRFVADRMQSFDGTRGREGVVLSLAAPSAGTTWSFPDGRAGRELTEVFAVYNPTDDEASVDLELQPAKGEAEPYELTVAPQSYTLVDIGKDERVPAGVAHSALVRSINGVPVVAERLIVAGEGATRAGVTILLGGRRTASAWVFADGRATGSVDEWIVVLNPGSTARTVSLFGLVGGQRLPIADLQDLKVKPFGRLALRLGDHIERDELAVLVSADGPVTAERGLYAVGATGMSAAIGIPLR